MNYTKKPDFNLYQSRHCAYITYSVKTWFLKVLSVHPNKMFEPLCIYSVTLCDNTYVVDENLCK